MEQVRGIGSGQGCQMHGAAVSVFEGSVNVCVFVNLESVCVGGGCFHQ